MWRLLGRLRARLRYRDFNADLEAELAEHRALAEEALRRAGETPERARTLARRQLGNITIAREAARGVWLAPWLEGLVQDVRYASRTLWHSRGFTLTAVATLVLGVGLNTTLFSLANALLLRPWNAPDAHELVLAYHRLDRSSGQMLVGVSAPELSYLEGNAKTVTLAGVRNVEGRLATVDGSRSVRGKAVSGRYFDVLKLPVVVGRGLNAADHSPTASPAIVISHDLWRSVFGGDPGVVGRAVQLGSQPATIVGVAGPRPAQSSLDRVPDFWTPLWAMAALYPDEAFAREFMANAGHCCVDLVGRLQAHATRTQAEAELSLLDRQFRDDGNRGLGMRVTGTATAYHPEGAAIVPVFGLLAAGAVLVLLLTSANVGNLQLARAVSRRREVSLRLALGAGRARIVRQFLTEGFVLAVAAVGLCVAASSTTARAIALRMEPSLGATLDFSIDGRTLAVASALTLATCLLTSLAPAIRGTRNLAVGRVATSSLRLRSILLSAQVAITIVLLTAAGLLSRSLTRAATLDVGFRLDTLIALKIDRASDDAPAHRRAAEDVLAALRSAGRPDIAIAAVMPLGDESLRTSVRRAGEGYEADRPVHFMPVSANYFDVLGIPIRTGRSLRDGAVDEVVVNETLARALWPAGEAVGQHLAGPNGTVGRRVVGVVADARLTDLGRVEPTIFQPADAPRFLLFHQGTTRADQIAAFVASLDPQATTSVHQVGENGRSTLAAASLGARVAALLGLLALAVSAVGIAGVFHFVVTERTREIGIRVALGSTPHGIRLLLLRGTGGPLMAGALAGLLVALPASTVLRSYLYGLSPSDPVTYGAVIVVVTVTAWLATLIPMRRALSIDPSISLRHE